MYNRPRGLQYVRFLTHLHQEMLFDWYMEVGCRSGRTLAPTRSKTIAVDPYFLANSNIIGTKPELHLFQTKSDDFFETGYLKKMSIKLSFSFLDGMHLFEYLLRDFMNTEANSRPEGIIALHDCCPYDDTMTSRDLDNLPKGPWTGDVWKLIPILQTYRPKLKITVLDCKPTGLVLISGLEPRSSVLAKNYDRILAEYRDLDLDRYGPEKFFGSFDYVSANAFRLSGFAMFSHLQLDPSLALSPAKITP